MNATDAHEYVVQGFADLLKRLDAGDTKADAIARIKSNTAARERARNRVWKEYGALGLMPPSDDALSITARRELGYPLPQPVAEAAE